MKKSKMLKHISDQLTSGLLEGLYIDRLKQAKPPAEIADDRVAGRMWVKCLRIAETDCEKIDSWNQINSKI